MNLGGYAEAQTAAIYLMGYGAELALKIAVCELLGTPASQDPWAWIKMSKKTLGIAVKDIRTHDIRDLWQQVNDRREGIGLDVRDPAFHGALLYHSWRVYTHWWEELRYKNIVATEVEVTEVAESVFWLLAHVEEIYQ